MGGENDRYAVPCRSRKPVKRLLNVRRDAFNQHGMRVPAPNIGHHGVISRLGPGLFHFFDIGANAER